MERNEANSGGFDYVFKYVGGRGLYQWRLLAIVSIQMTVLTFHHLGFVFLGAIPTHWCSVDALNDSGWTLEQIKNISIPKFLNEDSGELVWSECEFYDLNYTDILERSSSYEEAAQIVNAKDVDEFKTSCNSWKYDTSIYSSTVVSQFDLVCSKRALVATIQATYMAGVLLGSLILSTLSDKVLGRRKVALISIALVIIPGFGAVFSPNYITFITLRFLIAMGVAGCYQSSYVLLLEYSEPSCRAFLGVVQQLPFAISCMIIPLLAYIFKNWWELQLAFVISALSLISYIWILPESSRWLASKGRTQEAIQILKNVATVNKRTLPNEIDLQNVLMRCTCVENERKNKMSMLSIVFSPITNIWLLVKTPKLRVRSLALWTLYFSVTVIYYGLSFVSIRFSNDPYILLFLSALMEVPAYSGLTVPLLSTIGRKPVIIGSFLITSLSLISLAFIPIVYSTIRIILALAGKLFVSCAFAIIYLLGAELYPTSMRATGLGSAVIFGRFGSMAAPYFSDIGSSSIGVQNLPIILFGTVSLLSALVGSTLPETRCLEMPDRVHDIEESPNRGVILSQLSNIDRIIQNTNNSGR